MTHSTRNHGSPSRQQATVDASVLPSVKSINHRRMAGTKLHHCTICNHPIQVGEVHDVWIYIDLDHLPKPAWRRSRTHLTCPPLSEVL